MDLLNRAKKSLLHQISLIIESEKLRFFDNVDSRVSSGFGKQIFGDHYLPNIQGILDPDQLGIVKIYIETAFDGRLDCESVIFHDHRHLARFHHAIRQGIRIGL